MNSQPVEQTRIQTRISRIVVGRVYNLGNYENIRYEVAVDVAPGDDPGEILANVEAVLNDLQAKSGVDGYDLRRARAVLERPAAELNETDARHLDSYRNTLKRHEEAEARRKTARQALSTLGGSSEYKDAKDSWDDD